MTITELENIVRKHMLLADDYIIKLLCAFVVSARLPINPLWLFIIGASSGGKSQLLKALESCQNVIPLDDLTANTFVSGMQRGAEETSLIHQLRPNSILVFKDFTTIISKEQEARGVIIGQLRKIYDGDINKRFGNGKVEKWQGKLAVLGAATSSLYSSLYMFASMGERFLMYKFEQPDRIKQGKAATQHLDKRAAEEEMKKAFKEFIDKINIPKELPPIDEELRNQIVELAELVTRCRTSVERERFDRTKPIIQVHLLEMPGRFASQVLALAYGFMIINKGPLHEADKKTLYKMALDSIPNHRRLCLTALTEFQSVETAGIAVHLRLPTDSIRRHLQDLAALDVITWEKGKGNRDKWRLKDKYRDLIAQYEGIEKSSETLTGPADDDNDNEIFANEEDINKSSQAQKVADLMGGEIIIE